LKVDIFVHTEHRGNPKGNGEAMAVLEFVGKTKEAYVRTVTAAVENDTKNALTLMVIVAALKKLVKPCDVAIHTDNKYIRLCISNGWLEDWHKGKWLKANGKVPANVELWKGLYLSMQMHKVTFVPYEERQEFQRKAVSL
jgi:ribonuclease HI